MNETRVFDGLGQVDPSRFVKSDDNVGLRARRASAPTNRRPGPDSVGCCAVRSVRKQS
jgi:hypothetical protein